MLKKLGIIAATVTAGVLAVSAVAFAQPSVESGNLTNDCPASQEAGTFDQDVNGGSSLLGAASPVTGAVAPVTTQTQAANCLNVGVSDLLDSDSNNVDRTWTSTEIEDSYNESLTVED